MKLLWKLIILRLLKARDNLNHVVTLVYDISDYLADLLDVEVSVFKMLNSSGSGLCRLFSFSDNVYLHCAYAILGRSPYVMNEFVSGRMQLVINIV